LLLLSYDAWKPQKEEYHQYLAEWIKNGGILILFDGKDSFDDINMFWKKAGFVNPQAHLINTLDLDYNRIEENERVDEIEYCHKKIHKGHLIVYKFSPESIAVNNDSKQKYLSLIRDCARKYMNEELQEPQYLYIERNRFVICHTFDCKFKLDGRFIDIFSANLNVLADIALEPNTSVILYSIEKSLKSRKPCILYSTFRLMGKKETKNKTSFFIQGPNDVEGKVRIFTAGKEIETIEAFRNSGEIVNIKYTLDNESKTILISFPYDSNGIGFKINWK
jgi:hypothetical protein